MLASRTVLCANGMKSLRVLARVPCPLYYASHYTKPCLLRGIDETLPMGKAR